MKKLIWFTPIMLVFAALWVGTAFAQDPTPSDDDVNRIAKQLFCPVCENTPLDVCPTQACAQWRALIREKLAAGWTEEQIKQYFVDQYGARVLSEPPRTGLNWLVYLVPPVLFVVGVIILVRTFRSPKESKGGDGTDSISTPTDGTPAQPAAGSDDYVARLEEELKKRN
jgi:cytochrome c-type biogenesis protein CcmH